MRNFDDDKESANSPFFSLEKAPDVKRAGTLYVLGGLVFLLTIAIGMSTYPGFSIHSNALSDLAATTAPTFFFADLGGFVFALCWTLAAYCLFRNTGSVWMRVLYLVGGLAFFLVVLSPENVSIAIHSLGAAIGAPSRALAVLVSYRMIRSRFRYFALFLGALSIASILVLFGAYYSPLVQQTLGPGGWEVMYVLPVLVWLIGFGSYLLAIGSNLTKIRAGAN